MTQSNQNMPPRRTLLNLHVKCSNVVKADFMTESDPFVKVFLKRDNWYHPHTGKKLEGFIEIGQTEHVPDNPDPIFAQTFMIEHIFEQAQTLKFECWDHESNDSHKHLGSCQIDVATLLHSPGSMQALYLLDPESGKKVLHEKRRNYQTLLARLDKVSDLDRDVILQLRASNLPKMYGSNCNAFFKLYRRTSVTRPNSHPPRPEELLVFNRRNKENSKLLGDGSGVNKNDNRDWILWNLAPNESKCWPALKITFADLCKCEAQLQCVVIEVWSANKRVKYDDPVGKVVYSFEELTRGVVKTLKYTNPNGKVEERGQIGVVECYLAPNIIDFIQAGTNVSMMCGIDFTRANGDPVRPHSLHYVGNKKQLDAMDCKLDAMDGKKFEQKSRSNPYQECIAAMTSILSRYDSDEMIPMFGFGLKAINQGRNVDCVDLNQWFAAAAGKQAHRESVKVAEVEWLYRKCLQALVKDPNLGMSAETRFSAVLEAAIARARNTHNAMIVTEDAASFTYHVLILLTAGAVCKQDQQRTIDLIVDAANIGYPISMIVIGIGEANFGFLEKLDADKIGLKNSRGEMMKRDIVQFVKFSEFSKSGDIHNLTKETLKEIPKQFVSYVLQHQNEIPERTKALNVKESIKIV